MVAGSEPDLTFFYVPVCSESGCERTPTFKIAAFWSYGPLQERKSYGLACDRHREALLRGAQLRRRALAVGDDEQVGPVEAIPLTILEAVPGRRPG